MDETLKVRREFTLPPGVDTTLENVETLIDEARKQYHRDFGTTTRDRKHWLRAAVIAGVFTMFYDFEQPHTTQQMRDTDLS